MTLNKQRILSELGSVVNQLQSADCGCIGKLFGNSPQNMNTNGYSFPQQGLQHGCHATAAACHGYGCHASSCREPNSTNPSQASHRSFSCLGQCNSPKLYSDTYNFLNENLMRPVVQEVYNDLSTITPANTIMNREMSNKMGVVQQGNMALGQGPTMNQGYCNNLNTGNPVNQIHNPHSIRNPQIAQNSQMMQNNQASGILQNQQCVGGMGPQIMKMIKGESIGNPVQPTQGQGQLTAPMIIDAPQSPHGKIGVTPLSTTPNTNNNNYSQLHSNNNISNTQQLNYETHALNTIPNMQQSNPTQQKSLDQQPSYGQHTQGIKKFNEMFPGVMQGLGGDLGFDPMAIAIQMNPANQQRVAMNTMQKMMNNNQNLEKILEPSSNSATTSGLSTCMTQNSSPTNQIQNTALQNEIQNHNVTMNPATNAYYQPNDLMFSNQSYNATNNQTMSQQNTLPSQLHQNVNSNTSTTQQNLQSVREDLLVTKANNQQLQSHTSQLSATPAIIKEPIFPVDTTKQKIFHNGNHNNMYSEPAYYNTLGQPVEKLPANMYHHPIPNLPQTLSPQPTINKGRYSNVKLTESKTSLMKEKPNDKTPSRSQLQQIYNQYKGSQSFTQQSVKSPVKGAATHSERRLNISQDEHKNEIPVEKVGGDSAFDQQLNGQRFNNVAHVKYDHVGDVLNENKPNGDISKPEKDQPHNNRKCRNGLQDMVYTSYPTSAAWTFHGDGQPVRQYSPRRGRRYNRY